MAFIPPELLKRLDAIARQEECSRSRVLALAARAYVEAKAA
jgi:metal-responsive CopG/Arc/MetJ family transcriptional regulator